MSDAWLQIAQSESIEDSILIDENYVENQAQFLVSLLASESKPSFLRLAEVWMEIGLPARRRQERIGEIFRLLSNNFLKNIVQTEELALQKLISDKETRLRDLRLLAEELGETPYPIPDNLPLILLAKNLHDKYVEWQSLKQERLQDWERVTSDVSALCTRLDLPLKVMATTRAVATGDDIARAKQHLSELNNLKRARLQKFSTLKTTICDLVYELEKTVEKTFEREVVYGDSENFILSEANMSKLLLFHSELEGEADRNLKRRKSLDRRLKELWDQLEVSLEERNIVVSTHMGYRPTVLQALEQEVNRLEDIKKERMEEFIIKLRPEIEYWWDKCYIGSDHRSNFNVYFESTDYCEQLLQIHERELRKLKDFFEENDHILLKITEYNNLWERFKDLEQRMNDPSRFNNRGGALLREEKERKKVWNGIPKLEKELVELCKVWREAHCLQDFCVWGIPVEDYVQAKRGEYEEAKENEKKSRGVRKKLDIEAQKAGRKITTPGVVLRKTPVKKPLQSKGSENNTPRLAQPKFGSAKKNVLAPNSGLNQMKSSTKSKNRVPTLEKKAPGSRRNLKPELVQAIRFKEIAETPKVDETYDVCEVDFQEQLKQGKADILNSTGLSLMSVDRD